jgi:hypothetical protein
MPRFLAIGFGAVDEAYRSTLGKILRKFCRRYDPCQEAFPDVT